MKFQCDVESVIQLDKSTFEEIINELKKPFL